MIGRLVLGRLAQGLVTLWLISVLVFGTTQLLPGDGAKALLGAGATPGAVAQLRHQLGEDKPVLQQYGTWLAHFVQGNWGQSIAYTTPVRSLIGIPMLNTLVLALVTVLLLVPITVALGVLSAVMRDRAVDSVLSVVALAASALPEFVVGTLLAYLLGIKAHLLPAVSLFPPDSSALRHPVDLVLPVLTLVAVSLAYMMRLVRGGVIDVLDRPFVQMARLRGMSERRIVLRHVLPNAIVATVQALALNVAYLLGGVAVVEFVFQYPGAGMAMVNAVSSRDVPVIQAIAVILGAAYIIVNIVADIATVLLTPRLRTAR